MIIGVLSTPYKCPPAPSDGAAPARPAGGSRARRPWLSSRHDGERLDPGRPADARDLGSGRVCDRRRGGGRNLAGRHVRRGSRGSGRRATRRADPTHEAVGRVSRARSRLPRDGPRPDRNRRQSRSSPISAQARCGGRPRGSSRTRPSSAPAGSSAGSTGNGRPRDVERPTPLTSRAGRAHRPSSVAAGSSVAAIRSSAGPRRTVSGVIASRKRRRATQGRH